MLVKAVIIALLLVNAIPTVVLADDPPEEPAQWPVPCVDITPDRMPPVEIYDCPENAP